MPKCIVEKCKNMTGEKDANIAFFRLPQDEQLKQIWLNTFIDMKSLDGEKDIRICSEHFDKSDVIQGISTSGSIKKYLKLDAVPNIKNNSSIATAVLNPSELNWPPTIITDMTERQIISKLISDHTYNKHICRSLPTPKKKRQQYMAKECELTPIRNNNTEHEQLLAMNSVTHSNYADANVNNVKQEDIAEDFGIKDSDDDINCTKYVLVELKQLLKVCNGCLENGCQAPLNAKKVISTGDVITISLQCKDGHVSHLGLP